MDFVADTLIGMDVNARTVGVETDDYYYTAKWDHILRQRLPDASFQDAFLLVNRWLLKDVPADGDPIVNLAHVFLHDGA